MTDEDSSMERKFWQQFCRFYIYFVLFYKILSSINLDMVSVGEEGEGHSMWRDLTEKAREPTVESLVRGIWRLRVSEAERGVREGV